MATTSLRQYAKNSAQFAYGGKLGAAFGIFELKGIIDSDNKVKALMKSLGQMLVLRLALAAGFATLWSGMSKGIRSVLSDTGSLQAALDRLAKIKGLERSIAPLVGGMKAARLEVARIINLSAQNPMFGFEGFAEAAKTLRIFTRGAVDLKTVGDVAADTGNGINKTADAIGDFYDRLEHGESITNATDRLKEMGIVSESEARNLSKMADSGADAISMTQELAGALAAHAGGMDRSAASGDPAEAAAAHLAAQEKLRQSFGSPWTEDDVVNTKNMAVAMNAVAPAVREVSQFAHDLTGGFSTLWSTIVRFTSTIPGFNSMLAGTVEVMMSLIAAVSAAGAVWLAWSLNFGQTAAALSSIVARLAQLAQGSAIATAAVRALGIAVAAAEITTGIGLLVVVLGAAYAAYEHFSDSSARATQELQDLTRAHNESTAAVKEEIAAIEDLATKHNAMARAVDESTKAYQEWLDALGTKKEAEAYRNLKEKRALVEQAAESVTPGDDTRERIEGEAKERRARATFEHQMAIANPSERIALQKTEASRSGSLSAQGRAETVGRADTVHSRAEIEASEAQAREGLKEMQALREKSIGLGKEGEGNKALAEQQIKEYQQTLNEKEAQRLAVGQTSTSSGVRSETSIQQIDAELRAKEAEELLKSRKESGAPQEAIDAAQAEMDRNRLLAGGFAGGDKQQLLDQRKGFVRSGAESKKIEEGRDENEQRANQLSEAANAAQRELEITNLRMAAEKQIAGLKGNQAERAEQEYSIRQKAIQDEMDLLREQARNLGGEADPRQLDALDNKKKELANQEVERLKGLAESRMEIDRTLEAHQARRRGQYGTAIRLEDLGSFQQHFDQLKGQFGEQEASQRALALTKDDIAESVANRPSVVDSLQRIGGGGNAGGGDPLLDVARRQKELAEESKVLLEQIRDKAVPKVGPVYSQ